MIVSCNYNGHLKIESITFSFTKVNSLIAAVATNHACRKSCMQQIMHVAVMHAANTYMLPQQLITHTANTCVQSTDAANHAYSKCTHAASAEIMHAANHACRKSCIQ